MMSLRHILENLAILSLPLVFLLVIALGVVEALLPRPSSTTSRAEPVAYSAPAGRTILVIVDSLREQAVHDHMPGLEAIRQAPQNAWRPVKTCSANFTISCIQTMLSGKESPFSSGLHNFTGKASQNLGVPGQIAKTPLVQDVISDYTIGSLYGDVTRREVNVEKWEGDWLDHDLESIALAEQWLTQPDDAPDVLILHVVGTDKIAHRLHPGNPEYAAHFEKVDAALTKLFAHIDPARDHLLVTGDHGHDERGFHTHDSLLIVQSPWLADVLDERLHDVDELAQTEVAYLLSATTHTAPPPGYEGRYLAMDDGAPAPPAMLPMREQLAAQLATREEDTLAEKIDALQEEREQAPWHTMMRMLPMLLFYLLWCVRAWPAKAPTHSKSARWVATYAALFWMIWWTGQILPAWWSVVMSAGIVLSSARSTTSRERTLMLLFGAPLIVVVAISLLGERWRLTMHATDGSTWASPLFFVGLIAAGAGLSWLLTQRLTRRIPETIGLLCLIGLPSGVYYYHAGQNITRGFLIGGAILMAHRLWRERTELRAALDGTRARLLGLLTATSCAALLWQYSGAWHWFSGLEMWIRRMPTWSIWSAYGVLALLLVWSLRQRTSRVLCTSLLVCTGFYSVWIGELPTARAVSTLVVALAASSWLGWTAHSARDDVRDSAWWAALCVMLFWTLFRGFEIDHVDFNFSFAYLEGLRTERDIAIASSVMTHSKYAIFLGFPLIALADARQHRWPLLVQGGLLVLHVRLVALLAQVAFGPLYTQEKLYELAITDLAFIVGMMLWIIGLTAGLAVIHRRTHLSPSRES